MNATPAGRRAWYYLLAALIIVTAVGSGLWLTAGFRSPSRDNSPRAAATGGEVLRRVLERGELRVAYLVLPPFLAKDSRSGQVSGIFADVAQGMASRLGVDLSWVEEVGLATLSVGLDAGRYDMVAFPLWRSASRAKNVAFSTPLFYSIVGAYVRADDHRFDNNLSAINRSDVTIAGIDGELAAEIARSDFPLARVSLLPQLSDYSQMLMEVVAKKADVTFYNRVFGERFMRQNPGQLRDITGDTPLRVFAECYVLPLRDQVFRSVIDATLLELIENGVVDRAFAANGEDPSRYYRPALPYRRPSD